MNQEDERITRLLQEIDANFNQSHQIASKLVQRVKEHTTTVENIHESIGIWKTFFHRFADQPETPSRVIDTPLKSSESFSRQIDTPSSDIHTPDFKTCQIRGLHTVRKAANDMSFYSDNSDEIEPDYPFMAATPYIKYRRPKTPLATENISLFSPKVYATPPTAEAQENEDPSLYHSPATPTVHSPLLSTTLRAMTPRTPLSNRLASVKTELGHEDDLLDDDLDEPVPEFTLDIFPPIFQKGPGAHQITQVYSKFLESESLDGMVRILRRWLIIALKILEFG